MVGARDVDARMSATSVIEEFEWQVDADPNRAAIRRAPGADDVSFGQLDAWANAIAWELIHRRGTRPEPVPLAVCEPDLMLAAALGVLKAGKFYVAVNPMHPASLVQSVLAEFDALLLLCDRRGEAAAHQGLSVLSVEELVADRVSDARSGRRSLDARPVPSSSAVRPGLRFDDTRLAYVLYTSGSTGRPRGVAQSRRDMLHNVARHRPLAVGREDCVSLLSADGFVAAVSNPYIALLGGAALAPYSFRDAGVEGMVDWLRTAGVTVLYAFPSFLRQLAALKATQVHRGLRLAYLGGETVLPADLAAARRLFPAATLSTGLNSSETGLTCLYLLRPDADLPDPVPVGRPVVDVEVAIVNESGALLGCGESGEIEIRSAYVRPVYWRTPSPPSAPRPLSPSSPSGPRSPLNSFSPLSPPTCGGVRDEAPKTAFRTGDRGRIDVDGIVHHLGRIDGMVKVRGFRVESAEVEAAISALPDVAEVAVFAIGEDPSALELAACVVPHSADMDPRSVRSAVARRLPLAMIPARVSIVEALPRTRNGKLDRKRLARLAGTSASGETADSRGSGTTAGRSEVDAVAALAALDGPRESTASPGAQQASVEQRIAEIWRVELGIEHVGADDDFFALGGTSIVAVSVAARVRSEFGVQVPLAVLFETPTVAALTAAVAGLRRESKTVDFRTEPLLRELMALQAPLRAMSLADRRRQYERAERVLGADMAPGEVVDAGGCAAEWVLAQRNPAQPVVVYFHGGGYSLGSPRSHRHLAAAIGRAAGAAVLSVDYRRAPESAFPAAVDDAVAVTRWLLGRTCAPVVLAGDSAGGGLVVATMVALRDACASPARGVLSPASVGGVPALASVGGVPALASVGGVPALASVGGVPALAPVGGVSTPPAAVPMPVAGVCLSPWVDLACTADAHTRLAERDPLLNSAELKRMAAAYLREADPRNPLASPAFADLAGLPPLLIQVGTDEILLDDARGLADAARAAGVEVTLEEWPEMVHTWQWYFPILEEGRRAVANCAAFIRRRATGELPAKEARLRNEQERTVPASLIQEAHLQIVPATSGHGYLSWVYQLNGRLDAQALARAVDDVVRRHEILRARFEHRDGRLHVVVAPFAPGTLKLVDLTTHTKHDGLEAAIVDAEAGYDALSPAEDPRFRATLYTIGPKTSVLAMFVAEALVDSDSGSLLAAAVSRAYARHAGTQAPSDLPEVSGDSHLDYIASHHRDPAAVARAREYWAHQARSAPLVSGWPMTARESDAVGSTFAFQLTSAEWARVTSRAQALQSTPYVFVLTCLQMALARVADLRHFLAHSIVSERSDATKAMIGNFHSLVRIELRLDPNTSIGDAAARTAMAVAQAIDHCMVPAPLTASGTLMTMSSGDSLPGIRFYMFSNHEGPAFAGIRRRRFRLHGTPYAPLTLSCVHGPGGRQDFVFSSTTALPARLERLAIAFRVAMYALKPT
jgi:acetyl esterase/lipase/acyl-CoA synthetase (AMP-forming)/AMP-acid ligase II